MFTITKSSFLFNLIPAEGLIGAQVSGLSKLRKREMKGQKLSSFQDAVLVRSFSQQ
jgi:hypothetical protein